MKMLVKKFFSILLLTIFIVLYNFSLYASETKTTDDKVEVLLLLKIIDDKENLDKEVSRSEFAKMIVKASESKDKVVGGTTESVCTDVKNDNLYAGYIKEVLDKGHMFTYLGGLFKPDDYVTYSDLTRAMLSLLSDTKDDFSGNQVIARNLKFEDLKLNDNIDKSSSDVLTKLDIINGIYNTLKENIKDQKDVYGLKIFDKLVLDSDNELNAGNYIEKKVEGPFFITNEKDVTAPFEITKHNVYLNGLKSDIDSVKYDIGNYGYAIFYLDLDKEIVYAYTERDDVTSPLIVRKGFVQGIHYSASNITVPYRVDIDMNKYMLESEDVKFAFSAFGNIREGDYIIYICNKMNDVTSAYLDSEGNKVINNDETEIYSGSIVNAFHYETIKEKE